MSDTKLKACLATLSAAGWEPGLTEDSYQGITDIGFRTKTLPLAFVATEILLKEQPMTLRGLFYRVVSAGFLPSTDRPHYDRLCRLMAALREAGVVPFEWLVDHVRSTIKPSSWSGLTDFTETVRDAYRKDFWATLPSYVHVFVEKDAVAGLLSPVTREYDVPLSIIRGFVSLSFANEVAELWSQIEKPIFAFYLGDHDPSGLNLENDLRSKLERYCTQPFEWQRLAVTPDDIASFHLLPLKAKKTDSRTKRFLAAGYTECAELDAIPAPEMRKRVEGAILSHVPAEQWKRLQRTEQLEREHWHQVLDTMHGQTVA